MLEEGNDFRQILTYFHSSYIEMTLMTFILTLALTILKIYLHAKIKSSYLKVVNRYPVDGQTDSAENITCYG